MAFGTFFSSLSDLCTGLECLDQLYGLPYGGAVILKPAPTFLPECQKNLGMVTPDNDIVNLLLSLFDMHPDAWNDSIN